ncbi:hypothetical protein EI94DRAFT_1796650 [Lactarius quietus]|nr:hypothetical protein EI94DRAFT_1796650 [Lactarius quietus]
MVKAVVNGVVVAESTETAFVEGNHYFPPESVKVVLSISDTTYTCPYKGHASYYNAEVDGKPVKDIIWSYPQPTSKVEIKGKYAFDKYAVQAQAQIVE